MMTETSFSESPWDENSNPWDEGGQSVVVETIMEDDCDSCGFGEDEKSSSSSTNTNTTTTTTSTDEPGHIVPGNNNKKKKNNNNMTTMTMMMMTLNNDLCDAEIEDVQLKKSEFSMASVDGDDESYLSPPPPDISSSDESLEYPDIDQDSLDDNDGDDDEAIIVIDNEPTTSHLENYYLNCLGSITNDDDDYDNKIKEVHHHDVYSSCPGGNLLDKSCEDFVHVYTNNLQNVLCPLPTMVLPLSREEEEHFYATKIQAMVRGAMARQGVRDWILEDCSIFLQSIARGWLTRKRLRKEREEEEAKVKEAKLVMQARRLVEEGARLKAKKAALIAAEEENARRRKEEQQRRRRQQVVETALVQKKDDELLKLTALEVVKKVAAEEEAARLMTEEEVRLKEKKAAKHAKVTKLMEEEESRLHAEKETRLVLEDDDNDEVPFKVAAAKEVRDTPPPEERKGKKAFTLEEYTSNADDDSLSTVSDVEGFLDEASELIQKSFMNETVKLRHNEKANSSSNNNNKKGNLLDQTQDFVFVSSENIQNQCYKTQDFVCVSAIQFQETFCPLPTTSDQNHGISLPIITEEDVLNDPECRNHEAAIYDVSRDDNSLVSPSPIQAKYAKTFDDDDDDDLLEKEGTPSKALENIEQPVDDLAFILAQENHRNARVSSLVPSERRERIMAKFRESSSASGVVRKKVPSGRGSDSPLPPAEGILFKVSGNGKTFEKENRDPNKSTQVKTDDGLPTQVLTTKRLSRKIYELQKVFKTKDEVCEQIGQRRENEDDRITDNNTRITNFFQRVERFEQQKSMSSKDDCSRKVSSTCEKSSSCSGDDGIHKILSSCEKSPSVVQTCSEDNNDSRKVSSSCEKSRNLVQKIQAKRVTLVQKKKGEAPQSSIFQETHATSTPSTLNVSTKAESFEDELEDFLTRRKCSPLKTHDGFKSPEMAFKRRDRFTYAAHRAINSSNVLNNSQVLKSILPATPPSPISRHKLVTDYGTPTAVNLIEPSKLDFQVEYASSDPECRDIYQDSFDEIVHRHRGFGDSAISTPRDSSKAAFEKKRTSPQSVMDFMLFEVDETQVEVQEDDISFQESTKAIVRNYRVYDVCKRNSLL